MSATTLRTRARTALLLATVACSACHAETSPVEIPLPALVEVEPDVARAIEAACERVRADPLSDEAWGGLGDRYAAHLLLDEAALCYARADELNPESYRWAYRHGWVLFMTGSDQAVEPLERALRSLGSFHAPAHEAYAQALVRVGREDEAREHFRRASELDPEAPHAETGLGLIALSRGDLETARAHLVEAVARDATHGEAHIGLARVYMALGLDEKARTHAELSGKLPLISDRHDSLVNPVLPPAGARARTDYGLLLEEQGKRGQAVEQYRIALESDPYHHQARKRLAMLLVKSDRREEAIELLSEADRDGTSSEQTRSYLARLLERGRGARRDD